MSEETQAAVTDPTPAPAQTSTPAENSPPAEVAQATASADTPPVAESKDAEKPAAVDYEPFSLPEGVSIDEELVGEFSATAKELNLPQKDAQKLVDIAVKMQAKQDERLRQVRDSWLEASKTDKEFGGEKLNENLGVAKKAVEAFATPELRKLLDDSGFGNHPEVIRHFLRVGKALSEDGRVVTGSKSGIPADPAKRLFPNQA